MQDKDNVTLKTATAFEVIYRVFLILYILFSAVILGLNFGIDFLSELRDALINRYGNLTVPTMIISTVLIFVPFCISVFLNMKQLNNRIDNITDIQIPSLKKAIEKSQNRLKDSQKYMIQTERIKDKYHTQKIGLEQKLISIQGSVNNANYTFLQANEYVNKIVMHTTLADNNDLKSSMAEYEKSLHELKQYIRTDYSR